METNTELDDCRARLSAAEQERDAQEKTLAACARLLGDSMPEWTPMPVRELGCQVCAAAEARAEAAADVLTLADNLADRVERDDPGAAEWGRWVELVAYRDARAALAGREERQ